MKKLLFAIAGAAAFAAFAGSDPAAGEGVISLVGFEAYTTNTTVLGYNDQGQSGDSLWTSTGDDESRVQAYGGDNATAPSAPDVSFPAPFTEVGAGDNYLALDTSGAELQRAIPVAGQAVAATGTYIDTLVQFTVTEDEEPTIDGTTKLAIWMGVGDGATNLYVKGGYMVGPVGEGGVTIDTTDRRTYKLDSVVEPGAWYRLTVKAVVIDDDGAGNCISGYQVFIDGTRATSETAVCDEAAVQYYTTYANADGIFPGAAGLLSAKTIIPSCAGVQSDATITSVGFQGTGAIDDFVVTTNDPFPPSVVNFTLTYTAGDANVTLGAVTVGEDTVTFTENAASIVSNATVKIAAPTFAEGYQLAALTVGGTPVADPVFPYSFTMTANTTVEITAEQIPATEDWVNNPATDITAGATAATAYPGLADSALATADAQKLTVWAKAKNIAYNDIKNDTTGTYTEAYLLNCTVAEVEDEKEAFVANITIGANGTPVVTPPANKSYNGTLKLKAKVNLGDLTWTDVEAASTTYKFYMYELSL